MVGRVVITFLAAVLFTWGHELITDVKRERAVIVEIKYADGMPFSYEKYEVYYSGKPDIPFVTGRTDRYGRVIFIPDKAGQWVVKAFSEDGHGVVKKIKVDDGGAYSGGEKGGFDRILKLAVGIAVIMGFFGIIGIIWRKR
ncbi:hypothetical protein [Persephonella sp.]